MNSIKQNISKLSEHPQKHANKVSKLVFAWMAPIFMTAGRKNENFEMTNLSNPMRSDESKKLTDYLEQSWQEEVTKNSKPSFLRVLIKCFLAQYLFQGLFIGFYMILKSIQPALLKYFIDLFSDQSANRDLIENQMYFHGSVLILISVVTMFALHHAEMQQERIGMRIRSAVTSLVYRKILRLSQGSLRNISSGKVINLLSNDVSRFDEVVKFLNYLFVMPIQVPLITYLMYLQVNVASFSGIIVMFILTIPLQGFLGKLTSRLRLKMTQQTDHRIKLMYEIISGIKVIKMYAWEVPFESIVKLGRKLEVKTLIRLSYIRGLFLSFIMFTERISLFLTLVSFVSMGNDISAGIVFSLAQFFNMLQLSTAIFYPQAISSGAEVLVTIKRIQQLLTLEEQPERLTNSNSQLIAGEIVIDNVNAKWNQDGPLVLKDLCLKVKAGSLHAVIGQVGAGKSSFLNLLMGELAKEPKIESQLDICGSISYASQEPWLFAGTVRNNILFGQEYDKNRYKEVIRVCCLENDIDKWPYRDLTLIGDRGVSLSGGQRARINLARAIYRNADIYLLDDPLSAVDSHVGKDMFEQCICTFLKSKTTILVTHQVHFLTNVENITVLNEGSIVTSGPYTKIKNEVGIDSLNEHVETNEYDRDHEEVTIRKRTFSLSSNTIEDIDFVDQEVKEDRKKLKKSSFFLYFQANGNWFGVCLMFFVLVLGQIFCSLADYWSLYWTNSEDRQTNKTFYINIYVMLIIGSIVWISLRSILFYIIATRISRNLHNRMFKSLMQAPMHFFDTNPLGRILNRFSKDIGAADDRLPNFLLDFLQILTVMCGILAMVILTNPYMVVIIAILGAIFMKIRASYLRAAENLKRLEGQSKSPLFSHVSATLNGITTVRNCKAEAILCEEFDQLQNVHSSAFYLTLACTAAFGFWVDCVIVAFVACITYSFILFYTLSSPLANGGYVGLAISQSFILTGMLPYGVRKLAEVVNEMTSVERVLEYTELESENKSVCEKIVMGPLWPRSGKLIFDRYCLKYAENGETILRNLCFTVESGQKIGIVGRTGAGKSSMISALFRLSLHTSGNILIDSVNIEDLKLEELRTKISIIPQEPVLFSATVRYNLDPFNQFDDTSLRAALAEVELADSIKDLDLMVDQNGANFSLGQRQLICLARAILRNNRILILDEATANIDLETDALIQKTIREKFNNCTVLTIAHRLNTVIDSDKILVLSHGVVLEYDHAHTLLMNENGALSKLIQETGSSNARKLKELAKFHFESTQA